jgi:hypothetical protein
MKAHRLLLLSLLALCACNGPDNGPTTANKQPEPPKAATTASAATTTPVAPSALAKPDRDATLAAIKASGKTGLWSDNDGICAGEHGPVALMWNVASTSTARTALYRIKEDHTERLLARGGAIGARGIGGWVRPGMIFVLRAQGTSHELGRLVVAEKHC